MGQSLRLRRQTTSYQTVRVIFCSKQPVVSCDLLERESPSDAENPVRIALFGNHSNDGRLYQLLDEEGRLVFDVTMESLITDFEENAR